MGITTDNELQWCQFNNSAVWTTGTNQADKQPSLWGQLRVVGGEYVIAITDRSVVRGTYVGVEGGLTSSGSSTRFPPRSGAWPPVRCAMSGG
jgi:hypothetical protein